MANFKNLVKLRNLDFPFNSRNMEVEPDFFIFKARLVFTKLRKTFIKALILYYFNLKYHI